MRRKIEKIISEYKNKAKSFRFKIFEKISKSSETLVCEFRESIDFQNMNNHQVKMFALSFSIIVVSSVAIVHQHFYAKYLSQVNTEEKTVEELKKEYLEEKIRKEVAGHPIEKMAPFIAEKDEKTAAYLVGIAKKESNWGKRVPVLNGKDCFNYWGYRGIRDRMGSGGHTCFNSPKEAVSVVAGRIDEIIRNYKVESANDMVVWKCGYSCETHSNESVRKWISDVNYYSGKILN